MSINFGVGKTDDSDSIFFKTGCSAFIICLSFVRKMLAAVQFNRQFSLCAVKVRNKSSDCFFASETESDIGSNTYTISIFPARLHPSSALSLAESACDCKAKTPYPSVLLPLHFLNRPMIFLFEGGAIC